ncbi:hypothetical protein RHD99_06560 [Buttiauxella selenatireducens]|uniref:Lipoprotein n=1 Tax=Buttiauxella selenatireducens TaxID=3073902 RepID=A0ABY9SDM4_9ENTR|nr:hypothetical protein [Buttiauxella sp. R73]WMY75604.1 hypothetical protein RHD99_06560 [Buttiauxella sp. R73]
MPKNSSTRRSSIFFIVSCCMIFLSIQNSFAFDSLPKGKDYPAGHIYTGKPSEHIDITDEFTNSFRTRFKQAIQGDIVFAGEYAQAEWGCGGSGCHVIAFINKRTGLALSSSFMAYDAGDSETPKPIGEEILYINKGSDLLVTYETSDSSDKKFYNYYVLDKKKNDLTLIKKVQDTPH